MRCLPANGTMLKMLSTDRRFQEQQQDIAIMTSMRHQTCLKYVGICHVMFLTILLNHVQTICLKTKLMTENEFPLNNTCVLSLQTKRLVVLRNEIEVVQFQSNSPRYLPISEEFWMALAKLPPVYDYTAYRKILERFGTHYISEGSMGGSLTSIFSIDEETEKHISKSF